MVRLSLRPLPHNVFLSRDAASATAELRRGDAAESNDELGKCVQAVVDRWHFPRANTPTWLLLGFDFER